MTFLSILFALLIEQLKPLRADNPVYASIKSFAATIEGWFNAGHAHHGRLGWVVMVGALTVPVALVYWLLLHVSLVAAFAWNVLVVYMTLGFRHYSHYFTSIQLALNTGDDVAAPPCWPNRPRKTRRTSTSARFRASPPKKRWSPRIATCLACSSGS